MDRYSNVPRMTLSIAAAIGLASCASLGPPSVPRVTQVAATPAVVAQRMTKAMQDLGFVVAQGSGPGMISGSSEGAQADWAECPAAFVMDMSGRRQKEYPVSLSSSAVQVTLTPVGEATRVQVGSTFTGSFFDSDTGYSGTSSCHSQGVVEGRLLQAAQG